MSSFLIFRCECCLVYIRCSQPLFSGNRHHPLGHSWILVNTNPISLNLRLLPDDTGCMLCALLVTAFLSTGASRALSVPDSSLLVSVVMTRYLRPSFSKMWLFCAQLRHCFWPIGELPTNCLFRRRIGALVRSEMRSYNL